MHILYCLTLLHWLFIISSVFKIFSLWVCLVNAYWPVFKFTDPFFFSIHSWVYLLFIVSSFLFYFGFFFQILPFFIMAFWLVFFFIYSPSLLSICICSPIHFIFSCTSLNIFKVIITKFLHVNSNTYFLLHFKKILYTE